MGQLMADVRKKAGELRNKYPQYRWGQALYNALRILRPELAANICATEADPFYDNSKEDEFWTALAVMTWDGGVPARSRPGRCMPI